MRLRAVFDVLRVSGFRRGVIARKLHAFVVVGSLQLAHAEIIPRVPKRITQFPLLKHRRVMRYYRKGEKKRAVV